MQTDWSHFLILEMKKKVFPLISKLFHYEFDKDEQKLNLNQFSASI